MTDNWIIELAVIVFFATGLGVVTKFFKQPLVLAYIVTGFLTAYFNFLTPDHENVWRVFSDLGIVFLLFLVGLEINYQSIRLVGKDSLILGFGQVILTFLVGFIIASIFHYDFITASYIAIALTFSSTIIIVKLLSEKKDLNSLYGKLSVGILLIQDLVAVIILVVLSGLERDKNGIFISILLTLFQSALLILAMLWLGRKIIPKLFDYLASSEELLYLTSLAWAFMVVSLVSLIGFSVEIGGFLAGLTLANSSERYQIASKIKPLRDFFILIFFVILGSSIVFSNIGDLSWQIAVFSLFVIVGNPLIVMILMGIRGYRRRTGFLTGITLAQVSEFSLVLVALGYKLGHLEEEIVVLVTMVAVVTILVSSYLVIHADKIFSYLRKYLVIFERANNLRHIEHSSSERHKSIILIGVQRMGDSVAQQIAKDILLVVDFDPDVIKKLETQKYDYLFGDIADQEIMEKAHLDEASLIISTAPDFETNSSLLEKINYYRKNGNSNLKAVVRARTEFDAGLLYQQGADYVLLPHLTSGHYLGKAIARNPNLQFITNWRNRDQKLIKGGE